jgi:hypothetical protein
MKTKLLAIASVTAAALLAASAQAVVIAGWDFSQHRGPGSSSGGGSPLGATNADLDPTFKAGHESAFIGQATYNASAILPTAGLSLNCEKDNDGDGFEDGCSVPNVNGPVNSNVSAPFSYGSPSFDAFSILKSEGQTYTHRLGMTTDDTQSMVFNVAAGYTGGANNWVVSLGARMLTGTTSPLSVSISGTGGSGSCTPVGGSGTITTTDERKVFTCPAATHTSAAVTVNLSGSPGSQPVIDNVAIEATPIPEPAAIAQLLAGTGCLAGLYFRRR